jgi:protein MpaA
MKASSKSTQISSLPNWRTTSAGTPISLHSSQALAQLKNEKPIILIGGVHGDEPEGVRLASDALQWLKGHTGESLNSLCPWVLIPCLNVDGYAKKQRGNANGVDLNRNYPSKDWTSIAANARYSPGPSAASENETKGMVELITTLKPRLLIHCHSWNPCIVATGEPANIDGARLARNSGYDLRGEIGYPTPGSLSRYGWHDLQIPVICIEEQENLKDLSSIWPRFAKAMQQIFTDKSMRGAGA